MSRKTGADKMTDLSKGEIKIYEHNGSNQVEVIMQDNSIWR